MHAFAGLLIAVSALFSQDQPDLYAFEVGDDNGDGIVMEDESGWDCSTMGNRVCGPATDQVAGCYSDAGSLVAPWPCYVVVHSDGSSDVYQP